MLTVIEYGGSYMKAVCHNQSHHIRHYSALLQWAAKVMLIMQKKLLFISNPTLTNRM